MSHQDWVGRELDGGYRLVQLLGKEALGAVYLGEDANGARYRVKVLKSDASTARRRFARELEAARSIEHPNVLRLIAHGELDERPYLVFEHFEAKTLSDVIAERGALPVDEAVRIVRDVAEVLEVAHARGVVHRNLNPDNVLLPDEPGKPARVRDFGLARLEDSSGDDNGVTAANVRVGRLTYMAPEYIGSGEAGPAADLYALGVLLYELVTGDTPPVATYPLPPPSKARPELPARIDEAVLKLTAAEPEERPPDAAAARELLAIPAAGGGLPMPLLVGGGAVAVVVILLVVAVLAALLLLG